MDAVNDASKVAKAVDKAKLPTIAAELIGWNNGERLVTGKDPLTGEDANRWVAGAELAVDIASNFYPIAKAGKLRKLEKHSMQ